MRFHGGRMYDIWHGDGWYWSVTAWPRHLLLGFRPHPKNWRIYFIKPPARPGYKRIYAGPFEIEWS